MHNVADSIGYRKGGVRVTGQDEQGRLDEDTATGRGTAAGDQGRRDEPAAQSGDQPSDAVHDQHSDTDQPSDAEAPTEAGPDDTATDDQGNVAEQPKGDEGVGPFPPAFRWDNPSPNETTQVIAPISTEDTERTQVVRTPAPQQPGPLNDDSERTQVVQVGPPAPSPYEPPPYQPPNYQVSGFPPDGGQTMWTQQESAPPWVSSDLPPIPEPNAGWMMQQGPEFFEPETRQSSTGKIIAIVAAVVVLAGIAVGAYFLFRPSGQAVAAPPGSTATQPPTTQPSAAAPPAQGPLVAGLPGQVKDTAAVQDSGQLKQIQYLTEQELAVLSRAGASKVAFALSETNGTKLIILVIRTLDAPTARDQLAGLQAGLKTIPGLPAGVRSGSSDSVASGNPVLRRAHYASGDYVVRVEASGTDVSAVQALFRSILGDQLERLPING